MRRFGRGVDVVPPRLEESSLEECLYAESFHGESSHGPRSYWLAVCNTGRNSY